jgi:hypothetical protein
MVTANTGTLYAEGTNNVRRAWGRGQRRGPPTLRPGRRQRRPAGGPLWSSADDADPLTYSGVITGNSYGIVGAIYASHGTLLLFSDLFSINRMASVVYDVSGGGGGVRAVTGGVGYDLVPGRVTVAVGGGHARDGAGVALRQRGEPAGGHRALSVHAGGPLGRDDDPRRGRPRR